MGSNNKLNKYLNDGYIWITSLFVFYIIYSITIFNKYIKLPSNMIFLLCILFSLVKIFMDKHSNIGIFSIFIILVLSIIISLFSQDLMVFTETCLIIAAKDIDFRHIIKDYFYVGLITLMIPFCLSIVHILPNYKFSRGGIVRESFGFVYPTGLSEIIFILCVTYCILSYKKISYLRIIIFGFITFFIIHFTVTKMDYYCMIILLILIILRKFCPRVLNKLPFSFAWLSLPIMSGLSFYFAEEFNIYGSFNRFLENRLLYSNMALKDDGISVLGQKIYENADNLHSNNMVYFFIDQSVIRMAVKYGLILLILFIIFYTFKMFTLYTLHMNYLVLLFMVLVIRGFVDPNLLNIVGDPFLLILLANVSYFSLKRNGIYSHRKVSHVEEN